MGFNHGSRKYKNARNRFNGLICWQCIVNVGSYLSANSAVSSIEKPGSTDEVTTSPGAMVLEGT